MFLILPEFVALYVVSLRALKSDAFSRQIPPVAAQFSFDERDPSMRKPRPCLEIFSFHHRPYPATQQNCILDFGAIYGGRSTLLNGARARNN
jgi:hypothetical protein